MNCKVAKHRVSKVLRITLGALEPVLKHNPKMKIIHLFRDPRSIINSRIETKGYPLSWNPLGSLDIQNNAKALCSKMITDLREGEKLMRRFPERFRFIHYEDLVLNSDSIRKLYDYVGMTFHTDNLDNVYEIKINTAQRHSEKKERARRRNNALWWRTYLSYDNIRQIDAICYSVIVKLGYSIFDNVSDLRNITKTNGLHNIKFKL